MIANVSFKKNLDLKSLLMTKWLNGSTFGRYASSKVKVLENKNFNRNLITCRGFWWNTFRTTNFMLNSWSIILVSLFQAWITELKVLSPCFSWPADVDLTGQGSSQPKSLFFIQTLWTFVIFALKGLASRECFLVDHENSGLYLYLCVGVLNLLVGFLRRGAAGERKINHGASLPWGKWKKCLHG